MSCGGDGASGRVKHRPSILLQESGWGCRNTHTHSMITNTDTQSHMRLRAPQQMPPRTSRINEEVGKALLDHRIGLNKAIAKNKTYENARRLSEEYPASRRRRAWRAMLDADFNDSCMMCQKRGGGWGGASAGVPVDLRVGGWEAVGTSKTVWWDWNGRNNRHWYKFRGNGDRPEGESEQDRT